MTSYPVPQRQLRGHRPPRPSDRAALNGEHHAYLAAHLTPRDRWLARVLHEHRVLTGPQIAQLAFASPRVANRRLMLLYQWRVVDRFQPYLTRGSAPMHYVLDTAGAAALAAEDDLPDTSSSAGAKILGYRHDRALQIAHSLRLGHTVGNNGVFTALVAIAHHSRSDSDTTGGDSRAVTAWWSETRCARHFGDHVRPDAYGRWRDQDDGQSREVEFFLEYDCGTESLTRVAGKLAGYQRLASSSGIATPVLIWLPTAAREETARRALATALGELERPDLVPVATTAASLGGGRAGTDSPAAARWLPLHPGAPAGSAVEARVRLIRIARVWPQASPPSASGPHDISPPCESSGLAPPTPMPPTTPDWPGSTNMLGAAKR